MPLTKRRWINRQILVVVANMQRRGSESLRQLPERGKRADELIQHAAKVTAVSVPRLLAKAPAMRGHRTRKCSNCHQKCQLAQAKKSHNPLVRLHRDLPSSNSDI